MKAITILGAIAATVLFFFAIVFALAASIQTTATWLVTRGLLFIMGLAVIIGIYYIIRKPRTIIQRLEVSGQMQAAAIKCPNCSASIDANQIKIVSGVSYVRCPLELQDQENLGSQTG